MKKHYEKMCMTPLGMEFESNLLLIQGSTLDNADKVVTIDQAVGEFNFEDPDGGFSVDWD